MRMSYTRAPRPSRSEPSATFTAISAGAMLMADGKMPFRLLSPQSTRLSVRCRLT